VEKRGVGGEAPTIWGGGVRKLRRRTKQKGGLLGGERGRRKHELGGGGLTWGTIWRSSMGKWGRGELEGVV